MTHHHHHTQTTPPSPSPTEAGPGGCFTAVPGKFGHVPLDACNSYYAFEPRFALALAVALVVSMLALIHLVLALRTRKRHAWPVVLAALLETLAFALYAGGARNQQSAPLAAAHTLLYLMAPALIIVFLHSTFARMVWYWTPDQRVGPLGARRLDFLLATADFMAGIVQLFGAVLIAGNKSPGRDDKFLKMGAALFVSSLSVQLALLVVFIALVAAWHVGMNSYEAERAHSGFHDDEGKRKWKPLVAAVYAASILLVTRTSFRIAEFGQLIARHVGVGQLITGDGGSKLIIHRARLHYALDASAVILCLLVLAVAHPGRFLVGKDAEFPTRAEIKRERREAEELQAKKEVQFGGGSRESMSDRYWGTE